MATDHVLTPNEISRSAWDADIYGENSTCPCCKNRDTEQIVGNEALPWRNIFKTFQFKAFKCSLCGARFSWFRKPKGESASE